MSDFETVFKKTLANSNDAEEKFADAFEDVFGTTIEDVTIDYRLSSGELVLEHSIPEVEGHLEIAMDGLSDEADVDGSVGLPPEVFRD